MQNRDYRAEVLNLNGMCTGITQVSLDFCLYSRCSRAYRAVNLTLQDAPWCTQWSWLQNSLQAHHTPPWCTRDILQAGSPVILEASRFSKYRAVQQDVLYKNGTCQAAKHLENLGKNIKAKPLKFHQTRPSSRIKGKPKRYDWRSLDNGRPDELSLVSQSCCWWHSRNLNPGILALN